MRVHKWAGCVALAAVAGASCTAEPPPTERHAMVVSIHHEASNAGLAILKQGGNAVDAAVTVGFALAVVLPQAGNIGGGGFMLVRMNAPNAKSKTAKTAEAHFLDFREKAPGAATANMYLDAQGNIIKGLSTLGYKAIGVPGSVAGLAYAQKHFGKLTLAQDMAAAIRLATEGYVLSAEEARSLHASNLTKFPESTRIFQRDGNFYAAGRYLQAAGAGQDVAAHRREPGRLLSWADGEAACRQRRLAWRPADRG